MRLLKFAKEDENLRIEISRFLDDIWPRDRQLQALVEQHHHQDHIPLAEEKELRKKLAERGWLGLGIPVDYGGSGGTALQRYIFTEVMSYYGAPYPRAATTIIAPALLQHGSEELKHLFLPRISNGDLNFCLGYSEPQAGTDLASLNFNASIVDDGYLLNGMKIFTTRAQRADYVYLAVRTDRSGKKHQGITLLIVDLNDPGITIEPLPTMDGRTNITYYDNVFVPATNRVGEEGNGWSYLTGALGLERVGVFPLGHIRRCLEEIMGLAMEPTHGDRVPWHDPVIRYELSKLHTEFKATESLVESAVQTAATGELPGFVAAMVKTSVTEFKQRLVDYAGTFLGCTGQAWSGSTVAPINGAIAMLWADAIVHTFGAGTNEIQRDMIAQQGLGLPRTR